MDNLPYKRTLPSPPTVTVMGLYPLGLTVHLSVCPSVCFFSLNYIAGKWMDGFFMKISREVWYDTRNSSPRVSLFILDRLYKLFHLARLFHVPQTKRVFDLVFFLFFWPRSASCFQLNIAQLLDSFDIFPYFLPRFPFQCDLVITPVIVS